MIKARGPFRNPDAIIKLDNVLLEIKRIVFSVNQNDA